MKSLKGPLIPLLLAAAASAQNPIWSLRGTGIADGLGTSVSGVGDLNGDGYGDFVAGAPQSTLAHTAGLVRVYSGKDGSVLFEVSGDAAGDGFGVSVSRAGDVDNDGTPDLIVGATPVVQTTKPGYARVYSGKTFKPIHTVRGTAGSWFGVSVREFPDLDSDGHADFLVGAPFDDGTITDAGIVRVYSGKTAAVLRTFEGTAANEYFGYSVACAGDVDNDGTPDVIAGEYANSASHAGAGRARVFSGKNGAVLLSVHGRTLGAGFGFAVDGAGDVDRDGHADVICGALWDNATASVSGTVEVISGRTGGSIYLRSGDGAYDGLGSAVAGLGDVDGDGFPDFAGGAVEAYPPGRAGYVRVWSGKTGKELYTLRGERPQDWFGRSVASAADVDGDGGPDVVIGAGNATLDIALQGAVAVHAGSRLALTANVAKVSIGQGGLQLLSIRAGSRHGGALCFVLGSASGTRPGLALGNVTLPLVLDNYFLATLVSPNTLIWRNTLQLLDGAGNGGAFFNLPAGLLSPVLVGTKLTHAFVVFGANADFAAVSNPVELELVQ